MKTGKEIMWEWSKREEEAHTKIINEIIEVLTGDMANNPCAIAKAIVFGIFKYQEYKDECWRNPIRGERADKENKE